MTTKLRITLHDLRHDGIRFTIGGGYCLRRIRQFHDIDVSVHPDDWPLLLAKLPGGREVRFPLGEPESYITHYTLRFLGEKSLDFWCGSVIPGYEYGGPLVRLNVIDGISEWTEETALEFKKGTAALGVEKDARFLQSIGIE